MKLLAVIMSGAAALIIAAGPAAASETFSLRPMLVADIGHDVDALRSGAKYTEARIVDTSIVPEMPEIARLQNARGEALVRIDLSATGKLTSASISESSGNKAIDMSALRTARYFTYAPAQIAGQGIAGTYLVDLVYDDE